MATSYSHCHNFRMEDPNEDYWENKDYSQSYESNGKLGWIWRKGPSLGKKMVITGVVISSAPFILPPLVALSAIGFAFSVPAGFAFVTYVCTKKLINSLLPMPLPPPLLEHRTESNNEKENCVNGDDVRKGYEEDVDLEEAEKEFQEDTKNGVEMRIELAEEGNNEVDDYRGISPHKHEVDSRTNFNEIEEEGYVEDVGEYMEDEQLLNSDSIPDILEGIREAESEISLMKDEKNEMQIDSLQAVVVAAEVGGENENNVERVLEELAFLECRDVKEENGLVEEIRDEGKDDQKRQDSVAKETPKENERVFIKSMTQDKGDESGVMQDELKTVVEEKLVERVKSNGNHIADDVCVGISSDKKRGTLVLSNEDAREMADESGFDLFDHGTLAQDQIYSLTKKADGEELYSNNAVDVYHEVQFESSTMPVSENPETVSYQDTTTGTKQVSVDEEKIWEKIHAMRVIVGYKVAPQSSCEEELDALYIFTGVEPPQPPSPPRAFSKDSSHLLHIHEKLHFLMSVIGVK